MKDLCEIESNLPIYLAHKLNLYVVKSHYTYISLVILFPVIVQAFCMLEVLILIGIAFIVFKWHLPPQRQATGQYTYARASLSV